MLTFTEGRDQDKHMRGKGDGEKNHTSLRIKICGPNTRSHSQGRPIFSDLPLVVLPALYALYSYMQKKGISICIKTI